MKLFRILQSNHHFGTLIQIIPKFDDSLSLDIYPNKCFQIELIKYDSNNTTTLIGFSCYLFWLK